MLRNVDKLRAAPVHGVGCTRQAINLLNFKWVLPKISLLFCDFFFPSLQKSLPSRDDRFLVWATRRMCRIPDAQPFSSLIGAVYTPVTYFGSQTEALNMCSHWLVSTPRSDWLRNWHQLVNDSYRQHLQRWRFRLTSQIIALTEQSDCLEWMKYEISGHRFQKKNIEPGKTNHGQRVLNRVMANMIWVLIMLQVWIKNRFKKDTFIE